MTRVTTVLACLLVLIVGCGRDSGRDTRAKLTPATKVHTIEGDRADDSRDQNAAIESPDPNNDIADSANELAAKAHFIQGELHWSRDRYDEAVAEFSEAIRLAPKLAAAYQHRGSVRHDQGDLDAAIADYTSAIELEPDHASFYNDRGVFWKEQGDLEAAMTDSVTAIRLAPESISAYLLRSALWRLQGEYDKAIVDVDKVITIQPALLGAMRTIRGDIWLAKADFDSAIADYTTAIERLPEFAKFAQTKDLLGPYAGLYHKRGVARFGAEQYAKAIDDYDKAISLVPEWAQAIFNRARAASRLGDYRNAIDDFTKVIEISPDSPYGYDLYARLLATCPEEQFRDGSKAVELATKACDLLEWSNPAPIDTLAAAHAEVGGFDEAVRRQLEAIQLAHGGNAVDAYNARLELYRSSEPYRETIEAQEFAVD